MKLNYTKNFVLCLHAEIISFLVLSKFHFKYFTIHIFSSKHKLHLLYKLFVEENLLIIHTVCVCVRERERERERLKEYENMSTYVETGRRFILFFLSLSLSHTHTHTHTHTYTHRKFRKYKLA